MCAQAGPRRAVHPQPPFKKDDNAYIEQKNWTHVRKLRGWDRYHNSAAVEAMNDLYRNELRQWLNFFQPSAKLVKRVRMGSTLRRRYDLPPPPLDRLAAWEAGGPAVRPLAALMKLRKGLNPSELSRQIDRKLPRIYALAHTRLSPRVPPNGESRAFPNEVIGGASPKRRSWPPYGSRMAHHYRGLPRPSRTLYFSVENLNTVT
jgi:hypothetical protein